MYLRVIRRSTGASASETGEDLLDAAAVRETPPDRFFEPGASPRSISSTERPCRASW